MPGARGSPSSKRLQGTNLPDAQRVCGGDGHVGSDAGALPVASAHGHADLSVRDGDFESIADRIRPAGIGGARSPLANDFCALPILQQERHAFSSGECALARLMGDDLCRFGNRLRRCRSDGMTGRCSILHRSEPDRQRDDHDRTHVSDSCAVKEAISLQLPDKAGMTQTATAAKRVRSRAPSS